MYKKKRNKMIFNDDIDLSYVVVIYFMSTLLNVQYIVYPSCFIFILSINTIKSVFVAAGCMEIKKDQHIAILFAFSKYFQNKRQKSLK